MGRLDEIGGPAFLTALLNQVPTTLHTEYYGRIVLAHSQRRRLLTAANAIATLAYDQSVEIEQVMTGADKALSEAQDAATARENVNIGQVLSVCMTTPWNAARTPARSGA